MTPLVLGGRYEVREVLGRGGMAEVHRALDLRLNRVVAVKMLRADLARDPEFQDRFRREAQSAASLNHPAIVAVYDTGEDLVNGSRVPFIVMELVEGSTLRDILSSGRRMTTDRALEVVSGILAALDYSHRHGIVHRDIKPANVMLTPRGEVKVMDFGIARTIAEATAAVTQGSAVVGTAQYLSPEQAEGQQVDARTDLYSTGCVLFELLTERTPFVGESPVSIAFQHARSQPPPPSSLNPQLSMDIDNVVLKSLAKDRYDRYQTATEMRADLERVRSGAAVHARPVDLTQATQALAPVPVPLPERTVVRATPRRDVVERQVVEEPPRRRGHAGAYALLALAVIAVFAVAVLVGQQYLRNDNVQVPQVEGSTRQEARAVLEAAGLAVATEEKTQPSAEVDVDRVVTTEPAAPGDSVEKGSTVTLVLSSGPTAVRVPSGLNGQDVQDAIDALVAEDLVPNVVEENSAEEEGKVLGTDPGPGGSVAPGGQVTLRVSNGRVVVPSVVGRDLDEAKQVLKTSEGQFETNQASRPVDDPSQDRVVLSQVPEADSARPVGDTIILYYGQYTEPDLPDDTTTPEPPPESSAPEPSPS